MQRWSAATIEAIGKMLLLLGVSLTVLGRVPGLGRLPGDIIIQRGNSTLYVPMVTVLLVSIVLTIILNLVLRLIRG